MLVKQNGEKMQKLNLDEMQKIELNILKAFDTFCRKNGIMYSVGAGTMIGVVRHKGFIPWDDDVDIFMKREEYCKFIQLISEHNYYIDEHYYAKVPGMENYRYPFIKLMDDRTIVYENNCLKEEMGVWIDIFPIDYCSNTDKGATFIAERQKKLFNCYQEYNKLHPYDSIINITKNIFLVAYRLTHRWVKRDIFKYEKQLSENKKMLYSGTVVWTQSVKDVYPSDYFDEYVDMTFENVKVMVFKKYDQILKHRYGDYMVLPPENQRISHNPHSFLKDI